MFDYEYYEFGLMVLWQNSTFLQQQFAHNVVEIVAKLLDDKSINKLGKMCRIQFLAEK